VPYCSPHNNVLTRPLELGSCISRLNNYEYGTLGSFARKEDSDALFILNCTHVLAPSDNFDSNTIIVQPGMSSSIDHQVALLDTDTFRPLASTSRENAHESMDASIAKITCERTINHINNQITSRGYYGEAELKELEGVKVFKNGSTSNKTSGYIGAILGLELIYGKNLSCYYKDLITINNENEIAFSLGGDSGSLICDEDGRAIGLLIAGSPNSIPINQRVTYALPIERVINHLNISLLL
jgi:Peptidase family S64